METTQNYKRTVAGSVGAGVGALFNASGRTYFMLEHKTNTKYHNAGDTQKIIIDQVELGRDGSCQVRFDESCETVSRKHAAIQRSGENWKLIHLSTSNPTLVNGNPIQGEYILQNGDEIQLSVGGPRMGFIIPQGKQALTSSIGLTERMSLFRQQALAPYKRALWTMAILFVLIVAGLCFWNWSLSQDLSKQKAEALALQQQATELTTQIAELEQVANKTPELEAQLTELKNRRAQVVTRYQTVIKEVEKQDTNAAKELDNTVKTGSTTSSEAETTNVGTDGKPAPAEQTAEGVATDIAEYSPYVYSLKIDNIKISYVKTGKDIKHDIANPGVIGNGFLTEDGRFVTARQNVEPWIYYESFNDGTWRSELAQYVALGCNIEIMYSAYSSTGTAKKLTFTNRDFKRPKDDLEKGIIYIDSDKRKVFNKSIDRDIEYESGWSRPFPRHAKESACYAVIHGLANTGIPTSTSSIEGGKSLKIAGYEDNTDVHNLSTFRYLTSTTEYKDEANGTYILQDGSNAKGFLGSPAFIQNDDKGYTCVGVYVGKIEGRPRIVPIKSCK